MCIRDSFEASSLITRMTTDVTVLQNAINGGLRPLARAPIMLILGVGFSLAMNPRLALVFFVCAPVLGVALALILHKIAPMYGVLQRAVDALNNVVQEGLTAIRAVKAFVRGEYEEEKFEKANSALMQTSQKTFHYATLNLPAFQLCMYTSVSYTHLDVYKRQAVPQPTPVTTPFSLTVTMDSSSLSQVKSSGFL